MWLGFSFLNPGLDYKGCTTLNIIVKETMTMKVIMD